MILKTEAGSLQAIYTNILIAYHRGFLREHCMRWLLSLLLVSTRIFADPIEDLTPSSPEEIASLRTDPSIGGYVNPLSGQLSLKEEDLHILGAQDLTLSRIFLPPRIMGKYDDRNHRDKFELVAALSASKGWVIWPHLWCGVNAKSPYFQVRDPSGFVLEFKRVGKKWVLATLVYGMSNLLGEEPNSAADIRNTELEVDDQCARVTTPVGVERIYTKVGPGVFRLEKEILPNGKTIRYEFLNSEIDRVVATDLSGTHVYSFIKVLGSGHFQGSDGSEAAWSYENREIRGSKKKTTVGISRPLLTKSVNPFYSHSIGYNERQLLDYYDAKEMPIRCKYTGQKDIVSQIEKLSFPIGAYSFSYDHPIAGEKGGSTTVTHPSGAKTVYRFNHRLLLTAIENWNGPLINQKVFHYNEKQQIAKIETKDGSGTLLISKVYECDDAGNPLLETNIGDFGAFSIKRTFSKNRLIREEREDGLGFEYAYLKDTRLVTSKTTLDHGALIRKTTYEYDDCCNLICESIKGRTVVTYTLRNQSPSLHCVEWKEESDWDGQLIRKTHYGYDHWGHVTKEEIYGSDGQFAYAIERTYNQRGDLLAETNPLGQTANYEYDSRERIIREVPFSRKLAIIRKYDEKGRLFALQEDKHLTKFEYNDSDLLIRTMDYLGFTTRYSYDSVHQKPTEIDSLPMVTRIGYDAFGREIEKSDAYGNTRFTRYNAYGSPTEILHPSGGKESFQYASNGHLVSHTDPDGISTIYTRDVLGRICTKTIADATTLYQYNGYELVQETDAEGTTTQFFYDKVGRKTKEAVAGREVTFCYNPLGFLAKAQRGTRTTEYVRDCLGRVLHESTDGLKTSWTYDESGNISSLTKGGTTFFVYDSYDRLTEKTDPLGFRTAISYREGDKALIKRTTDPRGVEIVETYDPHGLLLKKEVPGIQLQEYEYDKNLSKVRLDHLSFSYSPEGWLTSMTEGGKRTTRYSHTPAGRIATKQLPDGQILAYAYDSYGRISKIGDLEFQYDRLGRLVGGTGFERTLDPLGNILRESFSNGLWIKTDYDALNRPLLRTLLDGSAIRYTYDPVFLRKVERVDLSGKVLYAHSYSSYDETGNLLAEMHRSPVRYSYDLMGRQTYRIDDFLTETCRYDAVGNLLEKGNRSYAYDSLSQLTKESLDHFSACYDGRYNCIEFNGQSNPVNELNELESETYDLNGNLLREGYAYDAHGRLVQANGQTLVYDAIGRRLSKGNTAFLYIRDEEIGSFERGQPKELRISGYRRAISIEMDSIPYIPIHDVQDTIRTLVDWKTGETKQNNESDAFGREINPVVPYAYASKCFDADTGLFYFGKRYYDPSLGRWLTPDPLGSINGSNLYQYVYNNPFRYTDLDGQFAFAIPLLMWGAELALPALSAIAVPILYGAATGAVAYGGYKVIQMLNETSYDFSAWEVTGVYVPDRPLPLTDYGIPVPEADVPHTELGARDGSKGKYPQAREFDGNGKPVRDIDFTDHGYPKKHPNPHQHRPKPNPTGGTPERGKPEPVPEWSY